MESKVFSFVVAIFSRLSKWFNESKCGALCDKFAAMCYKIYSTSAICRFFRTTRGEQKLQNSFLGKILGLPAKILLLLQKRFAKPVNRILNESAVCTSFEKWADVSIRLYGIVGCVFCVPMFLVNLQNRFAMYLIGVLFVFGLIMILVHKSLRQLFGGSAVVTALLGLFTELDTRTHPCMKCTKKQMLSAGVAGLLLSFFCIALGVRAFAVVVAGILAFAFLVRYLYLGIFLTVALSPMLPTMVLVGLSILCAAVFCLHVVTTEGFRFVKTPMNTYVVFFAIALVWGCVNSFSVISSASQVAVHLCFILFYFIVINCIRDKRQWSALIRLFLASAFVVALYGVLQNFIGIQGAESWLDEEMFEDIKVRVYSFFNNPNVLGEFLVMTIPLVIAVIWGKAKEEHKALFGFVFLSMAACMIFTWSRGAWLGVFFACALFLVIMDKRWTFFGILALLLLPILLVLSGNTAILERLLSVGNTSDTSTAYRVSIWQASLKMIRDFWISGIGIGSESFKTVYPVYSVAGADFALHSHNLYLQVWVEMGIMGIVSLASMILMYIKQVFSSAVMQTRKTSNSAKLVIALGAGVIGFLLQGLTDYVWYNYKILMIFWIVIALGISGANLVDQTSREEAGGGFSMMNVYQVVTDTNIGGAGRYLLNYVKHFDRETFRVTVLIPAKSMLKPLLEQFSDIAIIEVPFMADRSYDKRCVKVMEEIFRKEKIDIVHTHASLSARIAARRAKVGAIVSTRHCIEPTGRFPVSAIKGFLNNLLCDIYVAVSDAVVDNLVDCGIKKSKIRLVCNGVEPAKKIPPEEQMELKTQFGIGDETVFGIFARLEEVKGHCHFIDAAKQFLKQGGKGKFLIVGDGSLSEKLKEQAKEFPEIIFTGYVNDPSPLLNITDVNVISSSSEAMSLAILEAMSLGKPTIATRVGGNPQLIQNGENGLLTEYAKPNEMAEAFLKMAQDQGFYNLCAQRARDAYEQTYTAEIMVRNLENLYKEIAYGRE